MLWYAKIKAHKNNSKIDWNLQNINEEYESHQSINGYKGSIRVNLFVETNPPSYRTDPLHSNTVPALPDSVISSYEKVNKVY